MQNENLRKVENRKPNTMEEILYYGKRKKIDFFDSFFYIFFSLK